MSRVFLSVCVCRRKTVEGQKLLLPSEVMLQIKLAVSQVRYRREIRQREIRQREIRFPDADADAE